MIDLPERSEPSERSANSSPEHLTFAEAAERLNITNDAVRMRVRHGKLASIRVNERTFVLWPQPESEHRSAGHDDPHPGALVAQLEAENAFLRQQVDRQTHIIARLIQRLPDTPKLAAGEIPEDAPTAPRKGPLSDVSADPRGWPGKALSSRLRTRWRWGGADGFDG